jgi:SAM-dependent methyltransferase
MKAYYSKANFAPHSPYQLDECGNCGLVFQRYVGGEKFLTELYDVWLSKDGDPYRDNPIFRDVMEAPVESRDGHELMIVAAFLGKPLTSLKVLDFGMGLGLWARVAKALGCSTFGHDLSASRMLLAANAGIRVLEFDAISEHRFDFINTDQLFEHVVDPGGLAKMLADVLAPGGILKIAVPRGDGTPSRLKTGDWLTQVRSAKSLNPVLPLEHVNCFSAKALTNLGHSAALVRVLPRWSDRFSFLKHGMPRKPKRFAKAVLRPWHRFHGKYDLYTWFQRQ